MDFSAKDPRPVSERNAQCLSCHDPHRWSPFGPQIKPGVPIHETVPRHFTRFDDLQILRRSVCADCHEHIHATPVAHAA